MIFKAYLWNYFTHKRSLSIGLVSCNKDNFNAKDISNISEAYILKRTLLLVIQFNMKIKQGFLYNDVINATKNKNCPKDREWEIYINPLSLSKRESRNSFLRKRDTRFKFLFARLSIFTKMKICRLCFIIQNNNNKAERKVK